MVIIECSIIREHVCWREESVIYIMKVIAKLLVIRAASED